MAEIVLMEDSPSLRRILVRYLRDADHMVTAFENGASSQDEALLERADVLVTDLSMPEVDGRQVLRNAHMIDPDLPVIVMTGEEQTEEPLFDTAFGYLRKPFDEATFLSWIARAAATRTRYTENNESINESYIATGGGQAAADHTGMATTMSFCSSIADPTFFERLKRLLRRESATPLPEKMNRGFIANAPSTTSRDD